MIRVSINETTTSEGFKSISEESLLRILNHPHLNISCQNHLQKALETWCVVNIDEERRQERLKHLKKAISSRDKFLPVVPCVVGYTYENDFLDGEMDFEKFNYVDAKGFKIASSRPNLVMSGGEYSFRNSIWQMTTVCCL